MKAWRLEAQKINKQRERELATVGRVTTPTARVQKNYRIYMEKMHRITFGSNWLLDGLMIRAGLLDPLPTVPRSVLKPPAAAPAEGVIKRTLLAAKRWLSKFGS